VSADTLAAYRLLKAAHTTANGHDPAPGDRLQLLDPTTLFGIPVPDRPWLVPDWIPMRRATALYGAGGEGKTLLAQQLATACAIGRPWLDLYTRRARSVLLFCEDDEDEMHRRQEDINNHYDCTFADLGDMRWLPRLGHDNALMTFDGNGTPRHTPLFEQIRAAAIEHDAKLIVIDTLADVFTGNENDRGQARAFAQQTLGLLARELDGAVVSLAHPSRAGMNSGSGESGSTAWIGTFRSQLYLSTPKSDANGDDYEPADPDQRVLTRRKSNAARRDETVELRWQDGVFIPQQPAGGISASIERRSCERVFLDLLDAITTEGRRVSDSSRASNYAPKIFAQRPDRERFRKSDFERAMQSLFAQRQIAMGTRRAPNRKEYECIIRIGGGCAPGAPGHA